MTNRSGSRGSNKRSGQQKKSTSTYSTNNTRCLTARPAPASSQELRAPNRTRSLVEDEPIVRNDSNRHSTNTNTQALLDDLLVPQEALSQTPSLPRVVEATGITNFDATSAITSVDLMGVENSIILSFTKLYVFPKLKFIIKVSDDPRMQWSTHPQSLCQYVLKGCNINFDPKTPLQHQQQQWFAIRKVVADKITSLRNDKSSAIRIAFYGKMIMFDQHT